MGLAQARPNYSENRAIEQIRGSLRLQLVVRIKGPRKRAMTKMASTHKRNRLIEGQRAR